ncbi:MAG TPA: hypothetical protein VMO80_09385 [Terriglobales bacterium]|nr:hypothetical protein [Terriglobales bacterium]
MTTTAHVGTAAPGCPSRAKLGSEVDARVLARASLEEHVFEGYDLEGYGFSRDAALAAEAQG